MLRRKLVRNRNSGQVILPKDFLRNLDWHYGDILYINQIKQGLRIVKDISKKSLINPKKKGENK